MSAAAQDFSAAISFKLDETTALSLHRGALKKRAGRTAGSSHVAIAASGSKNAGGNSGGAATPSVGGGAGGTQVRFGKRILRETPVLASCAWKDSGGRTGCTRKFSSVVVVQ